MEINTTKTVRELTLEIPGATRVFEKMGIDYCCGGGKAFPEACAEAGVSTDEVVQSLEQARQANTPGAESTDWQRQSMSALTSYIVSKHHVFTKDELARLDALLSKVCSVHGQNHAELFRIQSMFQDLNRDLIPHMQKEEMVLFPYIEQMEKARSASRTMPVPFFGTVRNPIRTMMMEHDRAGEILKEIRQISGGFSVPKDGCISYETLYKALGVLEQDLHEHIHLENNILFPRAVEMEGSS
ncbi:MAG: iron-sulfur cluster repair di-iron protein [Blastocatellia bacterium]